MAGGYSSVVVVFTMAIVECDGSYKLSPYEVGPRSPRVEQRQIKSIAKVY